MTAVWPATLPQRLLLDGYSEGTRDARERTDMDRGPAKVQVLGSPGKPVSGTVRVTPNGKWRLERFFAEDTKGGALPFWMPAQTLDGTHLCTVDETPLLTAGGAPLLVRRWWLVTFGQAAPTYTQAGVRYAAALDLMVLL